MAEITSVKKLLFWFKCFIINDLTMKCVIKRGFFHTTHVQAVSNCVNNNNNNGTVTVWCGEARPGIL